MAFLSFFYMLNDIQNNLHSYRHATITENKLRMPCQAPCKIWGASASTSRLGDFVEMHLPHKTSLDRARDLRVLIFSAESCGEMIVSVSKTARVRKYHRLTANTRITSKQDLQNILSPIGHQQVLYPMIYIYSSITIKLRSLAEDYPFRRSYCCFFLALR